MTPIEQKRKELAEVTSSDRIESLQNMSYSKGFNLGVEMAQKEFIDNLIKRIEEGKITLTIYDIDELKQSLSNSPQRGEPDKTPTIPLPLQSGAESGKSEDTHSQDGSTRKDEQELSKTNSFLFRHPDSRKGKKEVKA